MSRHHKFHQGMRLYSAGRARLYVNEAERQAFIDACYQFPPLPRTFCLTLAYTGCRLSEARALRKADVQLKEGVISIRSLKKRGEEYVREVPIPRQLSQLYEIIHFGELSSDGAYMWDDTNPISRPTGYRYVKRVMLAAGIEGKQACPKGLRHGFGVHATRRGVQLHMLQKWMGHASMETTAIYATAFGKEEREIAERMWD